MFIFFHFFLLVAQFLNLYRLCENSSTTTVQPYKVFYRVDSSKFCFLNKTAIKIKKKGPSEIDNLCKARGITLERFLVIEFRGLMVLKEESLITKLAMQYYENSRSIEKFD